jgi:hypothetical protein
MRRASAGLSLLATAITCTACLSTTVAQTADGKQSIEYEMKVERAAQAVVWAIPAVAIWDVAVATKRDLGGDVGDVVFLSKPMVSRHGFLTANDVTPYVIASLTTENGPLVVEVPAAGEKAAYFGSFMDAWQVPVVDVGLSGEDKGKGGKYLFLPPGYTGAVPEGYLVYRPLTYAVEVSFRPVAKNGGTIEQVVEYGKSLKVYKLSEAANPPQTRFIDAYPKKWNTLPRYDINYFKEINTIVQKEPVLERDKAMMALLASIGIEKGKPFAPDAETSKALEEGARRGYDWMQHYFTTPGLACVPMWEGGQWQAWNLSREQAKQGFPFVTEDRLMIDERAGYYFFATSLPKNLGGDTFYLTGLRDHDGNLFNGTSTYRLRVPKDAPARDFWSVIVYSMKTKGFLDGKDRVGLSSKEMGKMKANADGSVDVYFAAKPPAGLESNWIPTGEDFFLLFRLYGPEKPLFDRTWKLGDVEKVK